MSNQDLIQMEKEMETSSTELSEITEISESNTFFKNWM